MDSRTARTLLTAEAERLRTTRDGLVGGHLVGEPVSALERDDRMTDETGPALVELTAEQAILAGLDADLHEVDEAMRRLDAGDYGRCQTCRQAIADDRLTAVPATRYCAEHETQAEVRRAAPELGEDAATGSDRIAELAALANLDLVPEDDPTTDEERDEAFTDAEDLAMHVDPRRS
jgi:RNA polymerase-binding transcription factor DksA